VRALLPDNDKCGPVDSAERTAFPL